jgi:hypothetical protein
MPTPQEFQVIKFAFLSVLAGLGLMLLVEFTLLMNLAVLCPYIYRVSPVASVRGCSLQFSDAHSV